MTKDIITLTTVIIKISALLVFGAGCLGLFVGLVVRTFKAALGVLI